MRSRKKLELSRETLRCLTSDLASEQLVEVQGGENASLSTCLHCPTTTIIVFSPTVVNTECWPTR